MTDKTPPTIKFLYQEEYHYLVPYLSSTGDLAVDLPTGSTTTARNFADLRNSVREISRRSLDLVHIIGLRVEHKAKDGSVNLEISRRDRWVAYADAKKAGPASRRPVVAYVTKPGGGTTLPRADDEWADAVEVDDPAAHHEAMADAVVSTRYYAPKVAFPFDQAIDDSLNAILAYEGERAAALETFFGLPHETLRHHLTTGVDPEEAVQIGQAELTRRAMAGETEKA